MVDLTVTYTNTNIVGRGLLSFASADDTSYVYFKAVAEARVSKDLPAGTGGSLVAHCTMLMICHLYASADPEVGMRSFNSGDFSGSQDAGETIYLKEYRQIIDDFQVSGDTSSADNVTRADAQMAEFKLDQVDLTTYYRSST